MKVLSTAIGVLGWIAAAWHRLFVGFHRGRVELHMRRADVHDKRAVARVKEAERIEAAASTLAPKKPKQAVIAPARRVRADGPLAAVSNFHPTNDEDRAGGDRSKA